VTKPGCQPPLAFGDKVRLYVLEIDHKAAGAARSGKYKASHFETWTCEAGVVKSAASPPAATPFKMLKLTRSSIATTPHVTSV
jgi:hypothetical protein